MLPDLLLSIPCSAEVHILCTELVHSRATDSEVSRFTCQNQQKGHKLIHVIKETQCKYITVYSVKLCFYVE